MNSTPDTRQEAQGGSTENGHAQDAPTLVLWEYLRKYWGTAVATLVVVVVATVFFTLGQKRIYEAQATVMFDPTPPRPLGSQIETVVDMGAGTYWNNQEYFETQYNIIKSHRVAVAVVGELGLHQDASFLADLPSGETTSQPVDSTPDAAALELRARLAVEPVKDSRLAVVKIRDANPERAQRILTAVVDAYVQQNLDNALASTSSATDWLRGQLDTLKTDLETSEMDLHRYRKENDILSVAFDDRSNMLREEMTNITVELTRVRAQLQQAQARSSVLAAVSESDPTEVASSELLGNTLLATLRGEFELAKRDRASLLGSGKGESHPDVAAATQRVEAAKKAVLKEIGNIKRAVARDVAVLQRQTGGLSGMFSEAKKQAHQLNLLEIEHNRLRRAKDNTEKLYSLILERTKEADLSQMLRVNNVSVIDQPLVPATPVSPRVPLNLAAGAFLGLLLGAAAAFARGWMDRTLKVPEDIEQDLRVTFLGLLPELGRGSEQGNYASNSAKRHRGRRVVQGAPELVVHNEPLSSIAEASRAIRTNLLFMAPDKPYKTLLVTSAGPSEGKTTVACCVAIAMAQAGQRVLLVDCDLRRPRIRRIFGISGDRGVTTALLDDTLAEAVFDSEVPNLAILPAGPIPPNPAELLHTDRFKRLLEEARKSYDRVIIDSAPVVAVTDPTILSTIADGTLLVVRAHKTRKEVAHHAIRSLSVVGGKLAGVVLNAVDFSRSEYKYSYYYQYYRKGYYRTEPSLQSEGTSPQDHQSLDG